MYCLVTTYKGIANNQALPNEGEIHIHLNDSLNEVFRVFYQTTYSLLGDIKARIEGDAHFTNADGTQDLGKTFQGTSGNTADIRVSPGECDLFINHKYEYVGLWVQSAFARCEMDINDLMYSLNNNVAIGLSNTKSFGDISDFATDCAGIVIRNTKVQGSLDSLVKASSFASNTFSQLSGMLEIVGSNVTLNLSSLAGKSTIIVFNSGTCAYGDIKYHADINETNIREIGHAGITGSIESLVARAQAAPNNKTTGTLTFSTNPKHFVNVTFGGISLADNTNVPNKGGAKFTWDAQGNITWN